MTEQDQDQYDIQLIDDIVVILGEYLESSDLSDCDEKTQDNVIRRFTEMFLFLEDIKEAYDQGSIGTTASKAVH